MGTLGTYLREAREARGLNLREAAQQTRISFAYLEAIEREDFAKLPGEVFVKGFLKNYSRFLGLPDDEVMKRYTALRPPATPPAGVPSSSAAAPAPSKQEPHRPQPSPREIHASEPAAPAPAAQGFEAYLWAAVAAIFCIAVLIAVLPGSRHAQKHAAAPHSAATISSQPASLPTTTLHQEKLYLQMTALEDVWVLVRTDSSPQKKAVLRKDEAVTWSADERFLVSFANAGAVKMVLNGRELTLNAPKQSIVRDLVITAAGIAMPKMDPEKPRPRKPKPAPPAPEVVQTPAAVAPAPAPAETAVPSRPE